MKLYRHFSAWIIALGFALCISTLSFGQVGAMAIFDQWLDKHSDVKADLTKDPNKINDPEYLKNHPNLKAYLDAHPQTRDQLRANPAAFMQAEKAYEKNEDSAAPSAAPKDDITKSELHNWNAYLDKHEDVRNDLTKNPNLIDDPAYLQKRPHLRAFLEEHPNTRRELKENPKLFMSRESAYDKAEDKKDKDNDKK